MFMNRTKQQQQKTHFTLHFLNNIHQMCQIMQQKHNTTSITLALPKSRSLPHYEQRLYHKLSSDANWRSPVACIVTGSVYPRENWPIYKVFSCQIMQ
jgi:hypothetical protein